MQTEDTEVLTRQSAAAAASKAHRTAGREIADATETGPCQQLFLDERRSGAHHGFLKHR
jgi:hypothetical protein